MQLEMIGTGRMGAGMARRPRAAGHDGAPNDADVDVLRGLHAGSAMRAEFGGHHEKKGDA